MSLNGQRVLVVGGGGGIGAATARAFAHGGAEVVIAGRSKQRLDEAATRIGGNVRVHSADATDADSIAGLFEAVGRIDHLVLTFGGEGLDGLGPFADLPEQTVRRVIDRKVLPYLAVLRAALPSLRRDGSVTFVTAASARAAIPGTVALAVANGALESAVPPLATELAPLRVNAVSPGLIDTDWWAGMPDAERGALLSATAEHTPAGRVGQPEDVATAIRFLAEHGFLTGIVLECSGGANLPTGR
jgi:NAD(P)-dependent dehydrogenase (short-subunit alcohol dehydrogenase family)